MVAPFMIRSEKSIFGLSLKMKYASPVPRFNESKNCRFMLALSVIKMAYNVLGVWRSGFDLEAGTVNLAQN
jgi:hypothetical protein